MSFIILTLFSLLFSANVLVTDSCSSFTRWKSTNNELADATQKTTTTTTKQIKMTTELPTTSISTTMKTIAPPVAANKLLLNERCPEDFGKEYCYNDGECYVKMTNEGKQLHCACKKPFDGPRCMEKMPDGEYVTKLGNSKLADEIEDVKVDVQKNEPTVVVVRDINAEPNYINERKPCTEPLDKDLCGEYGRCFMLLYSEVDFFCECDPPYQGERCENKQLDGFYGGGSNANKKRRRRSISFDDEPVDWNSDSEYHPESLFSS